MPILKINQNRGDLIEALEIVLSLASENMLDDKAIADNPDLADMAEDQSAAIAIVWALHGVLVDRQANQADPLQIDLAVKDQTEKGWADNGSYQLIKD